MDTYKQICAKLVEAWDSTADGEYEDFGRAASYLVDWTRAALSEPEMEGSTPRPADGEVAELVAWMRNQVTVHEVAQTQWAKRFVRVASLLERLSPPQPVPVTERLPGAEDGVVISWSEIRSPHVWAGKRRLINGPTEIWDWTFASIPCLEESGEFTHWLPASASVLPAGAIRQSNPSA